MWGFLLIFIFCPDLRVIPLKFLIFKNIGNNYCKNLSVIGCVKHEHRLHDLCVSLLHIFKSIEQDVYLFSTELFYDSASVVKDSAHMSYFLIFCFGVEWNKLLL